MTAQEARTHPQRNIIIRALGSESSVRADIETVQIRAQDMFLLCSDGLTNHVGDEQMRQVLLSEGTLAAKADR
jgi:protein phosphatase